MKRFVKLQVKYLIILYLLLPVFILKISAKEFTVKSYTLEDGVPHLSVSDVLQDNSGVLWFVSDNEIFTYDGLNWEIKHLSENVEDARYRKLLKDRKGNIWALPISWKEDIIYYDNGNWKAFPPIAKPSNSEVNLTSIDVKYDNDETEIYVGTESAGIFLFKDNKWLNLTFPGEPSPIKVNSLQLSENKLYVATELGLYFYDTKNSSPEFIKLVPGNILNLSIKETGSSASKKLVIWLLGDGWLGSLENEKLNVLSRQISIEGNRCDIEADDEFIYVGEKHMLVYVNKITGSVNNFDKEKFHYRDGANSIFIDREENIWTTNNRGVHKIRKSRFDSFPKEDELLATEVSAIEFFEDGTMLLGHNNGISLVNADGIKTIDFMNSLPIEKNHSRVLSITRNNKGNILFVSQTYGLGEIDKNGNIKWYSFEDEVYDYFSVHRDRRGNVWASAGHRLYQLVNSKLQRKNLFYENDFIRIINSTKEGSLLLGTALNGVIILEDGITNTISSELSRANSIFALHQTTNGDILAGTLDGLYIVEDDKLVKFIDNDFRIDQPVFFIQPDSSNNLWFGLDNGVIKLDGTNHYKYGTNDGLAGAETNRAAGKVDRHGSFWIGTNGGLSRYSKINSEQVIKPLSMFLYIVTDNGKEYELKTDVEFDDQVNSLTLHFRGVSFIDEKQNKNRIRLVNTGTKEEKTFYTNFNQFVLNDLSYGEYIIFLSTRNANGIWGDEIQSAVITNPNFSYSTVLLFSILGIFIIAAFISITKVSKHFANLKSNDTTKSYQMEEDEVSYGFENPKILKLKSLLKEEKIYLNPDISLSKLAAALSTNKTDLSKLINSNYKQNFNNLINNYRVKEAKKMLTDNSYHHYTVEAIAEMTGFKSKSAFHKAFKEFTGLTPYQFKKQKMNT